MKLSKLTDLRFTPALNKLIQQPLPLNTALKLKNVSLQISEELKRYEEARVAALYKFGKKKEDGSLTADDAGNVIFEAEDNAKSFADEITKLLSSEVEVPSFNASEFGSDAKISSEEVSLLEFISL